MISFELSEIQEQIKDTAKKFAREEIAPSVIERDINAEYPAEIIKKLGELGFLGIMTDPQWGGSGLDAISYVLAMEEICKVDASVGIVVSVQNSLVNWILENYGSDDIKEKYLKPLAEGTKIGAFCLSEPEAGSDATQQHTTAERSGDKWILNGMKNWISSGRNADLNIVFAHANQELGYKGINCYIVEKGTKGWEPQKKEDKMGMRSSDTCSIAIENCEVPHENLIGKEGDGFYIAMQSLNGGRMGIASQAVGIAMGALEKSIQYSKERKAFGKPISQHQMIQEKLANMSTKISAAHNLVMYAAWLKDQHKNYTRASAEAKLFAASTAVEAARDAIQIHGGYGYVREYHVERMLRDAKVTEIYEGTSEIQKIVIARDLTRD